MCANAATSSAPEITPPPQNTSAPTIPPPPPKSSALEVIPPPKNSTTPPKYSTPKNGKSKETSPTQVYKPNLLVPFLVDLMYQVL